jgi:hypothetical protein
MLFAILYAMVMAAWMAPVDVPEADLHPQTVQAWDDYVRAVETRVDGELDRTGSGFLVLDRLSTAVRTEASATMAAGRVAVTPLAGPTLARAGRDVPDGLIHHWLGVVRLPGVRLDDVLAFVQRYDDSSRYFDDVIASKLVRRDGDEFEAFLKLRRQKIVTVVYNTTHRVRYRRLDATHAASRSIATRIAEVEDAGQPTEREKPVGRDSGYLWRLNSYWRFVESGGGVTVECESITLSREIPFGIGWLVHGIVEDISRESVQTTLASIKRGVHPTVTQRRPTPRT